MSLINKIRSTCVRARACLVVDNTVSDVQLQSLANIFSTVFVVASRRIALAKNIVYRLNFEYLDLLTEIDAVFIGKQNHCDFGKIKLAIRKTLPVVFVAGADSADQEFCNTVKNSGYQLKEISHNIQTWMPKK